MVLTVFAVDSVPFRREQVEVGVCQDGSNLGALLRNLHSLHEA